MLANPRWSLSAIHHGPNPNSVLFNGVVNREWKPLRKRSVEIPVRLPMNATKQLKALDVRVEADQEIATQPLLFILIKLEALDQVIPGKVKNLKPH